MGAEPGQGSMDNDRLTDLGSSGGGGYDAALLDHWLAGRTPGGDARPRRGSPRSLVPRSLRPRSLRPIVKPLPAGRFRVHGSNAELRWEVMRGQGYVVPNADFFVRNHTSTPLIDARDLEPERVRQRVAGSGPAGRSGAVQLPGPAGPAGAHGGLCDRVRGQRPELLRGPAGPGGARHALAARRDRGDGLARRPAVRRPGAGGDHPRGATGWCAPRPHSPARASAARQPGRWSARQPASPPPGRSAPVAWRQPRQPCPVTAPR